MSTNSSKSILLASDQQRSVLNALEANRPCSFAYSPYGHRPWGHGLLSLPGFNGELPDSLTGHYHLGNGYRQFNPVLMRFNSTDSWSPFGEGGLNYYAYCQGNPVHSIDPSGHTIEFLKPFLRKLGLMDETLIKQTQKQLNIAVTTTMENLHTIHAAGKTPREAYFHQVNAERMRQIHADKIFSNPEAYGKKVNTLTISEARELYAAKKQYAGEVREHASNSLPSSPIERTRKVRYLPSSTDDVNELAQTPKSGMQQITNIRSPGKSILKKRRVI